MGKLQINDNTDCEKIIDEVDDDHENIINELESDHENITEDNVNTYTEVGIPR